MHTASYQSQLQNGIGYFALKRSGIAVRTHDGV
jgi:hypothetical protein